MSAEAAALADALTAADRGRWHGRDRALAVLVAAGFTPAELAPGMGVSARALRRQVGRLALGEIRFCSCGAAISVSARTDAIHCSDRCRKRVSRLSTLSPTAVR